VVAMTATPITNRVQNIHNQLDILWPGRFGTAYQFISRYCKIGANEYSDFVIEGLKEETTPELSKRLEAVSIRRTQEDVKDMLPPFVITPIIVRAPKTGQFKKDSLEAYLNGKVPTEEDNVCGDKVLETVAYCLHELENNTHICILTHLKKTSHAIADELTKKGVNVFYMDGDMPTSKRHATIELSLKSDNAVLVTTMHAVKEGINNLVTFSQAIFAELYYTPGIMIQVLGRFHRITGTCPVSIMCFEGTHEEIIANKLQEKLIDNAQLMKAATGEANLVKSLSREISDEDFTADIRAACSSMISEEEY
jgi:SNF2 family DNA or RNA helicase